MTNNKNFEFAIQVSEVYKRFKTVKAVNGISFNVEQGNFVALLGPNGAGKTTMVEMIEGIQKPDSGQIVIDGKTWNESNNGLHGIIGLSLQETHFIDKLTVLETLKLFSSFYSLHKNRVDEVLELVNLVDKKKAYVKNLSGGQRQKLALGISLLNNPKIILLDEPTTGLDPNARREVWNILLNLKQNNKTSMILTTHYMEEAEKLCDNIIIIDYGSILKQGTLSELLNQKGEDKVIEFTVDKPITGCKLVSEFREKLKISNSNLSGVITIKNIESELQKFLKIVEESNLSLVNFGCRKLTLDDLFANLTGRHLNG